MRTVIQRVSEASVTIDGQVSGVIEHGLLILAGFEAEDTDEDLQWMARKICSMRIFGDDEGLMNLSVQDVRGGLLVVSQFTLHASTKKGNRPSFMKAAKPDQAIPLYQKFVALLKLESGIAPQTGEFGADMKVSLLNDGPVTITMDSKNKE